MFSVHLLGEPRPAHYNGFSKYSHLLEDAQYIRDFAGSDLTDLVTPEQGVMPSTRFALTRGYPGADFQKTVPFCCPEMRCFYGYNSIPAFSEWCGRQHLHTAHWQAAV